MTKERFCPKCGSENVALKEMEKPENKKWVCKQCGCEEFEFPIRKKEEKGTKGVL